LSAVRELEDLLDRRATEPVERRSFPPGWMGVQETDILKYRPSFRRAA